VRLKAEIEEDVATALRDGLACRFFHELAPIKR
jgi:hypothetical protein